MVGAASRRAVRRGIDAFGGSAVAVRLGAATRLVSAVLLVAVLVSACGGGSSAATRQADAAFLESVHSGAPDVGSYRTDVQLVRLGHAACDDFRSGASYEQLADRLVLLEGNKALPSEDLGAVITAAVENYCPKYRNIVQ